MGGGGTWWWVITRGVCDAGGPSCLSGRGCVVLDRALLAGLDPHLQPVLGRRQGAGVLRRVGTPGVVGEIEVEGVGPIVLGLEVEVAAGAVGLLAGCRVAEGDEQ